MGQRLTNHRLERTARRIREIQAELRVLEDQVPHFVSEAEDTEIRALVAETPEAAREHTEARRHADRIVARRNALRGQLAELKKSVDTMLDSIGGRP